MKFKVTDKSVNSISVEYEDGTKAVVPIFKGQDKDAIIASIGSYSNPDSFDSINDVPINVNDELETAKETPIIYDYRAARERHYPSVGNQLDALHWAREGDDTNLKAIDTRIKLVKDKISKSSTWTEDTLDKALD